MPPLSNVVGFDDAPFARSHRGDVLLVGAVCARTRLDGVLATHVRRDGANATTKMIDAVTRSQFASHLQAVLLQGIAVAGFNVVDVGELSRALSVPVLVVARRRPDLARMRRALTIGGPLGRGVPGAARKWELIETAGVMEPLAGLWVQRIGLSRSEAGELLRGTTLHGALPEAIRLAHLIAGGVTTGVSRGRA